MDPQVSASFIPKKPLAETRSRGGGGSSIIFLLGILVFIVSILAAGGAFLYERYLESSLVSQKAALEKSQQAYDLPTIQALLRFDNRIAEARKLLNNHISPSAIFTLLSQQTLNKVQFTSFNFNVGSGKSPATVEMTGLADSFATVALQSDQLGASKELKNIIFSGVTLKENGQISFSVKADLDPALILYSNSYNVSQIQATVPIEPGSATTSLPKP